MTVHHFQLLHSCQLPGQNLSSSIDVKFIFKNNSADVAESVLYGGAIDDCKLTHGLDTHCSKSSYDVPHAVDPGEMFRVSVIAVGQRNGTVSSTIISTIKKDPDTNPLHSEYQLQQPNNTCTTLSYAVLSLSRIVWIELHADGSPCDDDKLEIGVTLYHACPPGSNLSVSARLCVCEPRLTKYTNSCTITNELGQIARDEGQQFWPGYDNQSDELIYHLATVPL